MTFFIVYLFIAGFALGFMACLCFWHVAQVRHQADIDALDEAFESYVDIVHAADARRGER